MLTSKKRIALFGAVALAILRNIGSRGVDQCSLEATENKEVVKTYRSGLERLLQGLGGAFGSGSGSGDGSGSGSGGRSDGDLDVIAGAVGLVKRPFSAVLDEFEGQVHAIFPGTLWCGPGDVAPNNETLGPFDRTDACCRSHDECPTNINAGSSFGNLENNGFFTRSACGCDHAFYQCLKRANSLLSAGIGNMYFNILRPQCFTCDYKIVGCAQKDSKRLVDKKCVEYKLDSSQNKSIQWFDNPDF